MHVKNNAKKIRPLLAALALVTLGATAQATPVAAQKTAVVKTATPQNGAVVKLGTAMQEEYLGGESAERTTTYLTGETAQQPVKHQAVPKPQG